MPSIDTPNMSLPLPTVGLQTGPQYATNINQCLSILDGHTHGPGSGVPIGSPGINLTSDLPFNVNNLTSVRTVRFTATTASSGTDIGCLYVRGGELFYNDVNSNVVRITFNGGLSSTAVFNGNISTTAITSAAGPTPATSGFIRMNNNTDFLSWRNAGNNADNRAFFDSSDNLRVIGGLGTGVRANNFQILEPAGGTVTTLQAPLSSSAYTLFMPTRPSSANGALFLTTAGNLTPNLQLSRAQLPTIGQQISSGSDTFSTTNNTATPVTNLSVTITTSGRPVFVGLMGDGSTNHNNIGVSRDADAAVANFQILRNASEVHRSKIVLTNTGSGQTALDLRVPVSSIWAFDTPASSSFTYRMLIWADNGSGSETAYCQYAKLIAYEL